MKKNDAKLNDQSLALAGIFQAAALVRDLARTGEAEANAFDTSIQSIYHIDAENVEQIYGYTAGLHLGFRELVRLLSRSTPIQDRDISRYLMGLIHLERKLNGSLPIRNNLGRRIKHAISQANYFSSKPQMIIKSLADIYLSTLGQLSFRLHVVGNVKYLNQTEIISKIRAVLLAGVRSAVLWRQLGGSRWQLIFMRSKLLHTVQQLKAKLT